jgi:hypothetical protein
MLGVPQQRGDARDPRGPMGWSGRDSRDVREQGGRDKDGQRRAGAQDGGRRVRRVRLGRQGRTPRSRTASLKLDETGLTLEVGGGRPIRAGYRDLSLIAIRSRPRSSCWATAPTRCAGCSRSSATSSGRSCGTARAAAQAAPHRRSGEGARRSGRAARIRLEADDRPARARSRRTGRPDRYRRRPVRDPSVGLRRLSGGRAGHVDPLPARLDREGDAAVAG